MATPKKKPTRNKPTRKKPTRNARARSQRLLTRGLKTTDHYIALCQALISDITGGRVTKREALQSIRTANRWLLDWSKKAGW